MQLHLRQLSLSLAVACALAPPAVAATGPADDQTTTLDQVVVTATRTAVTADQSLAAVEVIDREQIQRSQARSLPDLLRGRAGINLVNQGGLGKVSTLFLRGTESDHTLFLVDGVRIGSATSGLTALQDLPLELIERIEIVRGPRSSLYGSEAIGGVIQVFTRGGRDGVHPRLRLGAGSHGLREAGAGVDIGGARGWFGVDYTHQGSDGIDACRGIGAPFYAGCGMDSPDPDRDGYENNALSLRAGIELGDALSADAHALRSAGRNAYDADPAWGLPDNSDTIQQVVGGKLRYAAGERVTLQLAAGRNLDASDNFLGQVFSDRFQSTRDSATLQTDLTLAAGQLLTLGADWSRDRAEVAGPFATFDAHRGNRAAFAQYQGRFGRHDLQAALRRDDNDQFGGHTTGSLAWGRDFAHGLRVTASVGSAFKAPTFNELYYPFFGNPDLRPETSRSAELGLAQRRDAWHWQLNAFQTAIDALIVYDPNRFQANNIDSARIRGAELTAGTTLAGWELAAQASVLDPRNRSTTDDGKLLPRRARRTARVDADRRFGDWRIGASWVAEGARYDDVGNALRLGGYATVDLRAELAFARAWTLQASVRNAFDRDYETAAYYRQPGREFGLTLRWAPQ
ncbi:TonB-dependent vitamin B12 receptor [Cognatiluteimonas weifangensis]|uniref:TonB-dependent vitamin B12 receptor n=1 Tax=Cognatiluteimonas weifangensis TaxID=2303539 RepID=A0A372DQR0_9GAMM|nr:TonB-dependent vitamin B12 receptor [Luteimonas weifangensis]RFP61886.1 TonB-dependent vitamin B12 receptor [Luteimonas weifangensis]